MTCGRLRRRTVRYSRFKTFKKFQNIAQLAARRGAAGIFVMPGFPRKFPVTPSIYPPRGIPWLGFRVQVSGSGLPPGWAWTDPPFAPSCNPPSGLRSRTCRSAAMHRSLDPTGFRTARGDPLFAPPAPHESRMKASGKARTARSTPCPAGERKNPRALAPGPRQARPCPGRCSQPRAGPLPAHPNSLTAVAATSWPWWRAPSSSFWLGWRWPWPPAMVLAP